MVNYARMQAIAKKQIEGNGRLVTLRLRATAPADSSQPWRGKVTSGVGGPVSLSVKVVEEKSDDRDTPAEDFVHRAQLTFLVAYLSVNQDITYFSQLVDGTNLYEITGVKSISPGPVVIAYRITVKK